MLIFFSKLLCLTFALLPPVSADPVDPVFFASVHDVAVPWKNTHLCMLNVGYDFYANLNFQAHGKNYLCQW